ncbi:BTAD domain-containing putative transcriptional regulator [Streptomyces sp. NPDC059063]|uniref:AfsR/SARP family transcriptional regulator n=1 Tax=unclassified Streptomyces TaxID=2593676 RepID=UPI003698E21F
MTARFAVLGDIEVRVDGHPLAIGHLRQRQVLAALLVDANRTVPVDQLADRVWADRPPQRFRSTLYSYLSRLRQALQQAEGAGARIDKEPGGYRLTVDPAAVDLHRFRDLVAQARAAGDGEAALARYGQALGEWRGEAFAGLDTPWFNALRETLARERLAAELDRNDLALRQGRHGALLAELTATAEAHPLDERLAGQLMLALHGSGRSADALGHYRRTRERLAEELGVDPGTPLQELHQRILTGDPHLTPPHSPTAAAPPPPVPRQLPASPGVFTGRGKELDQLTKALDGSADAGGGPGGTVVISAIGGIGGVGKTWLAVRWAHENAHRFPDGQLYVNLRGFDPAARPMPVATAVRGFLDALGADPDGIPPHLDAQTALYRSLVAERRILIVLDNARDADQVRPLLPGSPASTVLITSRSRLTALVTTHGARPLPLDVLGRTDAHHLLVSHLGVPRVGAEPEAVAALVDHCAGLPLALGIVAARAATHPDFPLAVLAAELREATDRLDALDAGDLTASLRAAFAASYRALTPRAATLFALLGLVPGPDIGLAAAASLAALHEPDARPLLAELEAAHLVRQDVPGRYRMHDLVRLYAAEVARQQPDPVTGPTRPQAAQATEAARHQPGQVTEAALDRLVDFHLHTAYAANRLLDGPNTPFAFKPEPPAPGCSPLRPPDTATALQWFDAEHACLLAVQSLALATGRLPQVWQLAWTLISYHQGGYHLTEYLTAWRAALTAAEHHGESPAPRALAHWRLGHARSLTGDHSEALDHLGQALALSERTDDIAGQAHICRTLGRVWEQYGDDGRAFAHAQRALDLYRRLDNPFWHANQLNAVGWMHARLGRYPQARAHCEQALRLYREHARPADTASTLDSLGYIAHHTGRLPQAVEYYEQALALFREHADATNEADTLANLAETRHALGQTAQARAAWQQALALYEAQSRRAQAADVRARLR